MANPVDKSASRALISFVRSFTDLQEKHLRATLAIMRETVEGVMQGIQEISAKTASNKQKANQVLVSTCTAPDSDAEQAMADAQGEVDRVVVEAQGVGSQPRSAPAEELATKVRRTAGTFAKHMEALETLDDELQGLLMTMMGQLSRDDVIKQRVEHVMMALQELQTSLTYILTDYEARCRDGEVDRFIEEMKAHTLRTYTMEDEKRDFYQVFPDAKKTRAS